MCFSFSVVVLKIECFSLADNPSFKAFSIYSTKLVFVPFNNESETSVVILKLKLPNFTFSPLRDISLAVSPSLTKSILSIV